MEINIRDSLEKFIKSYEVSSGCVPRIGERIRIKGECHEIINIIWSYTLEEVDVYVRV
jgi:hypothetical protein